MLSAALILSLAASAFAQSVSVSAVQSVVAGPSLSASSALPLAPSAAASASASGAPVLSNTSYGFDCPAGYSLTYAITNATYTGVDLATATAFFSNWTGAAAPGMVTASSGSGVGATRTYMATPEITFSEVLVNTSTDAATGALHQNFNSTAPISVMGIEIASTFSDLQVYSNATNGLTTVQYFVNACTNNQPAVLAALPGLLSGATTYWASQLTGAVMSASMSGSMSGSMAPTGVVGGPLASASSRLASATGAPAAGLSSIAALPGGVLSSITAAPAGALSSLTAGIGGSIPTPSLRARGRWY